jgi:hypothetical protein
MNCEFKANGKLRGGTIIQDLGNDYLIEYHSPHKTKIILNKLKVKLLNYQKGGMRNDNNNQMP